MEVGMVNWGAVSAIGEVLGAVAVLATILYLARQVAQARTEVRRSVNQNRATIVRNLLMARATTSDLREAYLRAYRELGGPGSAFTNALMERTGLSYEQAAIVGWEQLAWWQYRLEVYSHVDELTPAQRDEFETGIRQNYGHQPVEKLFYETYRDTLPVDVVKYIDGLIGRRE
jgi:hypothetical protein